MVLASNAQTQTFKHMTIKSGFNQDVICEDKANLQTTVSQFPNPDLQGIDGSGFVFFTTDVQENGAMCGPDGIFKSSRTGATFKVDPKDLNALVLKGTKTVNIDGNTVPIPGGVVSGTLEFATPTKAKSIYVVGTSADGDSQIKVTINYTDGTTLEDNITMYNWDSKDAAAVQAAVVRNLGRMASKKNWAGEAGNIDAYGFQLFESAVNTDNTKTIKSVTVEETSDNRSAAIFAVSTSDDVVTDGIDSITAGESKATYYTLDGVQVKEPVKGVNIVKMADGTTKKVIKNK